MVVLCDTGRMADDLAGIDVFDDEPLHTPTLPPASADITMRLPNGDTLRVAVHGAEIRLTVAGADGLATAVMTDLDADAVHDALGRAIIGVRRTARGY